MASSAAGPAWTEWSTESFARAQAARRPVLLSVVTRWSAACREMDRTTFSDPAVIALTHAEWVPVRLDADMRPDLAERYTLEGWPTTAFLTETGELIGGGTFVGARRLEAAMRELTRVYRARRRELLAATADDAGLAPRRGCPTSSASADAVLDVAACLMAALEDRDAGARATDQALPACALQLLLRVGVRDDVAALRDAVRRTLDAMARGALWDTTHGGFYRPASTPASGAERAKLLEVNAGLLVTYAEAASALGEPRFADIAHGTVTFVESALRDGCHAAYHPSQYYLGAAAPDERGEARPAAPSDRDPDARGSGPADGDDDEVPSVDPVFYVDGNARLASAYLRAASCLDQPRLAEMAVAIIERVVATAYERAAGVAHCLDPRPRIPGLLGDQVAAGAALLDAAEATGRTAYADLAEELMRSAIRKLWDDGAGAMADRVRTRAGAGDVGRLGRPRYPFGLNCEAARLMARLGVTTGDATLLDRALQVLARFEPEWSRHGTLGAMWADAMLEVSTLSEKGAGGADLET